MSSIIKNIILDMDGTLLDYVPAYFDHNKSFKVIPIARPYLSLFMKYLFDNFEKVSIWTAAAKTWYDECYEKILKPSLPEGKSFHFIKTRNDYNSLAVVKPLRMIFEEYPDYNLENTLIIDDNPLTFAENIENAILIKSFYYDQLPKNIRLELEKYDFDLFNMIQILNKRKNNSQVEITTIQNSIWNELPFAFEIRFSNPSEDGDSVACIEDW